MKFYVVTDSDGPRYTVKYGVPGAVSVPVATTTHRGMALRIAEALAAQAGAGASNKVEANA